MLAVDPREHGAHVVLVADVRRHRDDARTRRFQLPDQLPGFRGGGALPSGENQVPRALRDHPAGEGEAEAAEAAGDEIRRVRVEQALVRRRRERSRLAAREGEREAGDAVLPRALGKPAQPVGRASGRETVRGQLGEALEALQDGLEPRDRLLGTLLQQGRDVDPRAGCAPRPGGGEEALHGRQRAGVDEAAERPEDAGDGGLRIERRVHQHVDAAPAGPLHDLLGQGGRPPVERADAVGRRVDRRIEDGRDLRAGRASHLDRGQADPAGIPEHQEPLRAEDPAVRVERALGGQEREQATVGRPGHHEVASEAKDHMARAGVAVRRTSSAPGR